MGLTTGKTWLDSGQKPRIHSFSTGSKLALGSTKRCTQCVQLDLSPAAGAWSWPILYSLPVWEIRQSITSFLRSPRLSLGSHARTSCPVQSMQCRHTPKRSQGKCTVRKTPKVGNTCTFGTGPRETKENHHKAEHHAAMVAWWTEKWFGRKCSLPNLETTEENSRQSHGDSPGHGPDSNKAPFDYTNAAPDTCRSTQPTV
jgi:hypothetical protein